MQGSGLSICRQNTMLQDVKNEIQKREERKKQNPLSSKHLEDLEAEKKQNDNETKGTLAAISAGSIIPVATTPISLGAISSVTAMQKKLNPKDIELLNNAGDEIINSVTNLGKKGVQIKDPGVVMNLSGTPDKVMEIFDPVYAASKGKNAFFTPKGVSRFAPNSVVINREKFAAGQFHELGHAFNYNNSAVWKKIQGLRTPCMALASGLAIFAAGTKNQEPKEGEELKKSQKATNFVRKHSGALAFLAMTPVLAEEGMASHRGCKWVKQLLPENLANHVKKTNGAAYISYVAAAAGLAIAAQAATKIKDHFVEKKNEDAEKPKK
ncbi:MAG: hypothetical protein LUE64_03980 [Candidatus Gastranaerophilales bacterium]|nr:hypothetical protein [Candidatus Gastranaerophilales bacterium]